MTAEDQKLLTDDGYEANAEPGTWVKRLTTNLECGCCWEDSVYRITEVKGSDFQGFSGEYMPANGPFEYYNTPTVAALLAKM